jgi:hypothetical protein
MEMLDDGLQGNITAIKKSMSEGGVLHQIASDLSRTRGLSIDEVGDVIHPPKEAKTPRWQMIENAREELNSKYVEHEGSILKLATAAGIRLQSTMNRQSIKKIDSERALIIAEGGANDTFIVRPAIAQSVISRAGLENNLYVIGSPNRKIDQKRTDGTPNPEHQKVTAHFRGIKGLIDIENYDSLTEYSTTIYTAMQRGYGFTDSYDPSNFNAMPDVVKMSNGKDKRYVTRAINTEQGVGIILSQLETSTKHQLVFATSGLYRTKLALQALQIAQTFPDKILKPAVVFGDELGFEVQDLGRTITTPNRSAVNYVPELVIASRIATKLGLM